MQREGVTQEEIQPVLDRIRLETMGTIDRYRQYAISLGWQEIEVDEEQHCVADHYSAVKKNLQAQRNELSHHIREQSLASMVEGLQQWVDSAKKGNLTWAVMHFRKKESS
jgi:sarcosine/dimethylglycine N-methyltransferase